MESLPVPFHFTATFVVAMVAAGASWISLTRRDFAPPTTFGRWAFAAGWGLLAAGEIAHGAFLASGELVQSAVALRSSAYALLALALLPRGRDKKQLSALAPAPAATMPTFLSFATAWLAWRSRLPASSRLALSFLMFGLSEAIFGLVAEAAGSDPGAAWLLAHALRLAAGVALGSWLWRAFSSSIRFRFVAVFVVLLLVVVVAISGAMTQVFASNVRRDALREAGREGELQSRRLDDQVRESLRLARLLARLPDTRADLADRDAEAVAARARGIQAPGGLFETLDFVAFLDTSGAIVGISAGDPSPDAQVLDEAEAVSLGGTDVVKSALEGLEAGSLDVVGARKIGVVSASPVLNPPGRDPPGTPIGLAGVVVVGRLLGEEYLQTLQAGGDTNFSIVTREGVVATTFPEGASELLEGAEVVFEREQTTERQRLIAGDEYFSSYVPLSRPDHQVVAAIVISRPSQVLELTQANVGRTLFAVAVAAAALGLVLAFLFGSRITRPIVDLRGAAERVRGGDLDVRVEVEGADEVGALGAAFNEMTGSIARLTGDLRAAADEEFRLRSRLETILQSMTDGVVAVDSERKVLALNREAERILGITQRQALGLPVEEVLTAVDSRGAPVRLPVYRLESGALGNALVSSRGNGNSTPVAITSGPIRDEDGNVTGAVAVVRDLTPEIEVEKMKTEFLSNISHELRTPLTPIKGYAEMLRRRDVPRKQAVRFLDSIMDSTKRLERIVEMLVDLSSIEAGRLVLRAEPVDLEKATAEIVDRWRVEAPKHRFERRGFRSLPPVNGDDRLMPRAIDELIDNAVKFSPKGGKVSLSASVERTRNGRVARVAVIDRGIGISPEQMGEIFGDFVQADASATREFGGLGLGLGYVRRIVEAHGGRLEAESAPGKGSVFSILLPLAEAGRRRVTRSRNARGKSIPRRRG